MNVPGLTVGKYGKRYINGKEVFLTSEMGTWDIVYKDMKNRIVYNVTRAEMLEEVRKAKLRGDKTIYYRNSHVNFEIDVDSCKRKPIGTWFSSYTNVFGGKFEPI